MLKFSWTQELLAPQVLGSAKLVGQSAAETIRQAGGGGVSAQVDWNGSVDGARGQHRGAHLKKMKAFWKKTARPGPTSFSGYRGEEEKRKKKTLALQHQYWEEGEGGGVGG